MSSKLNIIVLTGNISSGKSTVCKILKQAGKKVMSADALVHELLRQPQFQAEIQLHFDRPRTRRSTFVAQVRQQLFSNKKFSAWYVPWIHKHVAVQLKQLIQYHRKHKRGATLFLDIPLYFESARSWLKPTQVWLIWTPRSIRRRRWQARKKAPMKEMEKIERWQIPDEEKFQKVDIILVNSLGMRELKGQVFSALRMLKQGRF